MHKFLLEHMFSSLLGIYLGMEVLGHVVTICSGGINYDLGVENKPLDGIGDMN